MYCILMDKNTKSYYMRPNMLRFFAYSDPENYKSMGSNCMLIETEYDDIRELYTVLYNAGFTEGYLDDEPVFIRKKDVYFYDKNANDILYAQYALTKKADFLNYVKKESLYTLCKIKDDLVYFPTVSLNGESCVLTYTSEQRVPTKLRELYDNYRLVKMSYNVKCIINGQFTAE